MADATSSGGPPVTRREFLVRGGTLAAAGIAAVALGGVPGLGGSAAAAAVPDFALDALGQPGDWPTVRTQFLLPPDLVYLNCGSLGPSPGYVINETLKAWLALEQDPVTQGYGPLLQQADAARAKAAAFLGANADEVAVTRNTTDGMNAVAQGLELQPGQRVLTTDQEHPGGSVCWEYYAQRKGVVIDRVPLPIPARDPAAIIKLFADRLATKTRVVSVSHVTYPTGLRLPVREIAALARAAGAVMVVDGAQAPGGVAVDVATLDCDVYATSAHKWLLAPKGTGLLYISRRVREQIVPLLLHHGYGAYTAATGMQNVPGIIGLGAAVDFLNRVGKAAIEERNLALRRVLYAGLERLPQLRLLSPPDGPLAAPLVSFALPAGMSSEELATRLREHYHTVVKVLPGNWGPALRASCHLYNSEADVERLLTALRAELR